MARWGIRERVKNIDLIRIVGKSPGFAAGLHRELGARKLFSRAAMEIPDLREHSEEGLAEWFSNFFRRLDATTD